MQKSNIRNKEFQFFFKMFRRFATKATKSPLALFNGIYNPPTAMSKRTAKRWSLMVQEKAQGTKSEKRNINDFVTEKIYVLQETDHHKSLESIVGKKFGLEPSIARLKILNGEIWVKNSMHSKYMDVKPNAKVSYGDTICAAVKKKPLAKVIKEQKDIQVENLKVSVLYKDDRIIVINKWNAAVHGSLNLIQVVPRLIFQSTQFYPLWLEKMSLFPSWYIALIKALLDV